MRASSLQLDLGRGADRTTVNATSKLDETLLELSRSSPSRVLDLALDLRDPTLDSSRSRTVDDGVSSW